MVKMQTHYRSKAIGSKFDDLFLTDRNTHMVDSHGYSNAYSDAVTTEPLLICDVKSPCQADAVIPEAVSDVSANNNLTVDSLLSCRCLLKIKHPLTQAEYEVASHLMKGLSCGEIACRRNVSPETVKSQIARLLSKAEVRGRAAFMRRVLELNVKALQVIS